MKQWLVIAILSLSVACASNPKANLQIAALTVGESVLAIDQAERTVRAANLPDYTVADQASVSAGIVKALYASRAFERAAVAVPDSGSSAAVTAAKAGLDTSLQDLGKALPSVARVRTPILTAITAAQAALAAWRAQ